MFMYTYQENALPKGIDILFQTIMILFIYIYHSFPIIPYNSPSFPIIPYHSLSFPIIPYHSPLFPIILYLSLKGIDNLFQTIMILFIIIQQHNKKILDLIFVVPILNNFLLFIGDITSEILFQKTELMVKTASAFQQNL